MIILIKVLLVWFLLMLLGTNLIGMVVRGFFVDKNLEDMLHDPNTHDFLKEEIQNNTKHDNSITFIFSLILLGYFIALYYFGNAFVLLSGVMLIMSRIPDLLLEIKTGNKDAFKDESKVVYYLSSLLLWGSLVVLWYALK